MWNQKHNHSLNQSHTHTHPLLESYFISDNYSHQQSFECMCFSRILILLLLRQIMNCCHQLN